MPIELSKIAVDITRDVHYKWLNRKPSRYHNEQELLDAILVLEKEHNWTFGYLEMTIQIKFERLIELHSRGGN